MDMSRTRAKYTPLKTSMMHFKKILTFLQDPRRKILIFFMCYTWNFFIITSLFIHGWFVQVKYDGRS